MFTFEGGTNILIVDSYSGYADFKKLSGEYSQLVVSTVNGRLATHGVPNVIKTDNGPWYAAEKFKKFSID